MILVVVVPVVDVLVVIVPIVVVPVVVVHVVVVPEVKVPVMALSHSTASKTEREGRLPSKYFHHNFDPL